MFEIHFFWGGGMSLYTPVLKYKLFTQELTGVHKVSCRGKEADLDLDKYISGKHLGCLGSLLAALRGPT